MISFGPKGLVVHHIHHLPAGITWGPVSEWFAGAATLGAVLTALYFSMRGERRAEDARLRAVYAWCELQTTPTGAPVWFILVNNQTQFPVSEWSVELAWTSPGDNLPAIEVIDQAIAGVVPPGRQVFPWSPQAAPTTDADVAVTFSFRDGSGRRVTRRSTDLGVRAWSRMRHGLSCSSHRRPHD